MKQCTSPVPAHGNSCRRLPRIAIGVLAIGLVAGCSSSDGPADPTPPVAQTASLSVTVSGTPGGSAAPIDVTGPGGFSQSLPGGGQLTDLSPGDYTVVADSFLQAEFEYTPVNAIQTVRLDGGDSRTVGVDYASRLNRGELAVGIAGLPPTASGDVLISGPNGYSQALSASDTLRLLEPGTYSMVAAVVQDGTTQYAPFPPSDSADVVAGGLASFNVTYAEEQAGAVDLSVAGVELVQATQRATGDVPMIRDREALVRVYGIADGVDTSQPDVRLEFFVSGQLVYTTTATRSGLTTPTSVDRTSLNASWNTTLPAQWVQPTLGVRATIDPDNTVTESDESNNRYPVDGTPMGVTVSSLANLPLRFVPVLQTATGLQGRVDAATQDAFLDVARAIFPFPGIDADVRAPYTTDAPALQSDDSNSAWGTVLNEVLTLRNAEDPTRYYYGVVRVSYSSGVAGLGYVSGSRALGPNTAIGWDYSNSRSGVLAHELGHNLGRAHAPCGGAASPDPDYPYAGGSIGQWGYDPRTGVLVDPSTTTDIMGYCNTQWISDYNFEQILSFSGGTPRIWTATEQDCLVIWGRVDRDGLHLEPSFVVRAQPRVPAHRGEYEVDVRGRDGRRLTTVSFDPERVGCGEDPQLALFSWFLPLDAVALAEVTEVEVRGHRQRATQHARALAGDGRARALPYALERSARGHLLQWDAQAHPLVVVRERATGIWVALGRHGSIEFPSRSDDLEVLVSDGVKTLR